MDQSPNRSEHIAYSIAAGEPRLYEYEARWKLKALEIVQSLKADGRELTVLDFGCGRGEFLQMLHAGHIDCVGVDFDPRCVELGLQFARCYEASIDTLGQVLGSQRFDVVSCLHVLEHMEHPKAAVARLAELSKRWLIFAVPNLSTPERLTIKGIKDCNTGHYQGWDAGHLKNLLEEKCGLRIVRWVPDTVLVPKLSRTFGKLGIRRYFEYDLLPKRYPFLSLSLIVLCEKPDK